MKREGRQHGVVRSPAILLPPPIIDPMPNAKVVDCGGSPPAAAGFYTKAPQKPTNGSKYTGKCRRAKCAGCHLHPVTKSRNKAKGAHKLKDCDVALNHRLVLWRVVDEGNISAAYAGISASAILGQLSGSRCYEGGSDDDDDVVDERNKEGDNMEYNHDEEFTEPVDMATGYNEAEEGGEIGSSSAESTDSEDAAYDMDYYVVTFSWEDADGEDWLVVGEV